MSKKGGVGLRQVRSVDGRERSISLSNGPYVKIDQYGCKPTLSLEMAEKLVVLLKGRVALVPEAENVPEPEKAKETEVPVEGLPVSAPQREGAPEGAPEGDPEDDPEGAPEGGPEEESEDDPDGEPEGALKEKSEDGLEGAPEGESEEESKEIPSGDQDAAGKEESPKDTSGRGKKGKKKAPDRGGGLR